MSGAVARRRRRQLEDRPRARRARRRGARARRGPAQLAAPPRPRRAPRPCSTACSRTTEAGLDGRPGRRGRAAVHGRRRLPGRGGRAARGVEARGWAERVFVGNDTFAVLRAGTERGWGVAVVCGAGINCVGVAPDGRHARFPALGADHRRLGRRLRRRLRGRCSAAARSEDGRGPRTLLERAVPGALRPRHAARAGRGDPPRARSRTAPCSSCRRSSSRRPPTTRSPPGSSTGSPSEIVALARAALERLDLGRGAGRGPARRRVASVRRRPHCSQRDRGGAAAGRRRAPCVPRRPRRRSSAPRCSGSTSSAPPPRRRRGRASELEAAVERRERRTPMADVRFERATQDLRRHRRAGGGRARPAHRGRRVHGPRRPVGLRQDDRAAHARRPRGGRRRRRSSSATATSPTCRRRSATSRWSSRTTRSTRT